MSVWGELIGRAAFAWVKHRPFSEESRAAHRAKRTARRAKRDRQPDEAAGEFFSDDKETGMAINTGLRSSSNSAIAAVIVNVVVGVVNGLFPDFTIPADWLVYLTAGAMWVVGRFTKTPESPKVI